MTQPPFGDDPYSPQPGTGQQQPQYGHPSDYGQQPQYEQPQYGQPQYGQPQYGQPQYGEQQPQYGQGYPEYGQQQPPAKGRRTKLMITGSAAVVVLAAGGVATYVAVSDSGSGGASSPKAAIQTALTDLNNADLVGFLDDLAPGERTALAKPISDVISQLKRNDVLSKSADPKKVGGLEISAKNFSYAPTTVTVNDHVQIVQITGGTLKITGDASKVPLSRDFLDAVVPGGLHGTQSTTFDIAKELRRSGMKSARVAAQKVDGKWYPSLFYTVADNATYKRRLPTAADAIPAKGASSATAAVKSLLTSVVDGDVDSLVGVLSPDELGVLHDYGHLAIPIRSYESPLGGATLSDLTFTTKDASDGGVLVMLKSVSIKMRDGRTTTVERVGDCLRTTLKGAAASRVSTVCPGSSGATSIAGLIRGLTGVRLTARELTAINHLFTSATNIGIVTSQTDGSWYVDPVRTVLAEVSGLLGGLQSGDLLAITGIFRR